MRIKSFQDYLTEKRRNPEINRKINFIEFIKNTIGNDSLDNWFISFREEDTVTFINPFTGYNTPAGYYAYPLSKKDYDLITKNLTHKSSNDEIKKRLEKVYPFVPDKSNTIHLFKIKQNKIKQNKILTENSNAFNHIKEFYDVCKSNKKLKNNLPDDAFELLYNYINENISEVFFNLDSLVSDINVISKVPEEKWEKLEDALNNDSYTKILWFFVNNYVDLALLALGKSNGPQLKTKIYLDLGVEGFIDEGEDWFIHPNEPEQAIFFTRDVIDGLYSYDNKTIFNETDYIFSNVVSGNYNISKNNIVNVNGDVNFNYKSEDYKKVIKKYKFGHVSGDFMCSNNNLTSLEGAPDNVGGNFMCSNNNLTSLEGAPDNVEGSFMCYDNELTSLEGAPEEVGGDFVCTNNNLTSLEGAPEEVGGDFVCPVNKLTTLEGAPEEVGGDFNCSDNKLTSLEGAPEEVGGRFMCSRNNLTSLKGAPEEVGGAFFCFKNDKQFTEEDVKAVSDVNGKIKLF
jgi:hypothetical protein